MTDFDGHMDMRYAPIRDMPWRPIFEYEISSIIHTKDEAGVFHTWVIFENYSGYCSVCGPLEGVNRIPRRGYP